jgi:hypothetical protein
MDRTQRGRSAFTCQIHPNYVMFRTYDSLVNYEGFLSLVLGEHRPWSAAHGQLQVD